LYAEDPAKGFLPSVGRLGHFRFGLAHRVDTGVEQDAEVSPFYDPMIAKVISHGSDRDEAIDNLVEVFDGIEVWPIKTNAAFLRRAADHDDFRQGNVDTGFIARHEGQLIVPEQASDNEWQAAARLALADHWEDTAEAPQGFRLNAAPAMRVTLVSDGNAITVSNGLDAKLMTSDFGYPMVLVGGVNGSEAFSTFIDDDHIVTFSRGRATEFVRTARGSGHHHAHDGDIPSPMPGRIIAVEVAAGQAVTKGQKLVTLEAMKMEHSLVAPFDGTVAQLNAEAGGQVSEGTLLVRIEKAE